MKGKKFRYDENKLKKSSALKKDIALFLAKHDVEVREVEVNVAEILAYGLKTRPYVSFSDKELIKRLDALYSETHENLEALFKERDDRDSNRRHSGWVLDSKIKDAETLISKMQPLVDELIEEAFST